MGFSNRRGSFESPTGGKFWEKIFSKDNKTETSAVDTMQVEDSEKEGLSAVERKIRQEIDEFKKRKNNGRESDDNFDNDDTRNLPEA